MARNLEGIFTEIFAENGDRTVPPFAITDGWTPNYSIPPTSGGKAPERVSFNYLLNQLYALGVDVNRFGGALVWNITITYNVQAIVTTIDNKIYIALVQNIGSNPATNPADWLQIPMFADFSADTGLGLIGVTSPSFSNAQLQINDLQTQINNLKSRLPIIQGHFQKATGIFTGYGATVANTGNGDSLWTFVNAQPDIRYVASGVPEGPAGAMITIHNKNTNNFLIQTRDFNGIPEQYDIDLKIHRKELTAP